MQPFLVYSGVNMKLFLILAWVAFAFWLGVLYSDFYNKVDDVVCIGDSCEIYSQAGTIAEIRLN